MSELELMIFFDESGKKDDHPILMGGLSIPKTVYSRQEFVQLQGIRTHWADFNPSKQNHKSMILALVEAISKFEPTTKINVINYDYSAIEKIASGFPAPKVKEITTRTIYAKFPERIFYGLLRRNVKHINVLADIFIEDATEYKKYVKDVVENHLNVQAVYRGENFKVQSCQLKGKGMEVGIEITDLILGLIRFIIKNEPRSKSNRHDKKVQFVVDLLKKSSFYNIFSKRLMFFEWTIDNKLKEVDFNNYLKSFISQNHDIWF